MTRKPHEMQFDQLLTITAQALSDPQVAQQNLIDLGNPESLLEKAGYLWTAETIGLKLSEDDYLTLTKYLGEHWQESVPGLFNACADVYTSNLSLIYSALELVKNNHGVLRVQQTLTEIRDFVFDHLLDQGKLISSLHDKVVSPDELLTVWPFNLFSAEDLVLVQAADEIKAVFDKLDSYWQTLYIHYLISRSFFEEAEQLLTRIHDSDASMGMVMMLNERLNIVRSARMIGDGVQFEHTPFGNANHYEPMQTELSIHHPVVDQSVTFPVRIVSAHEFSAPRLVIQEGRKVRKVPLAQGEELYYANASFDHASVYTYWFEVTQGEDIVASTHYNLECAAVVPIHSMKLIDATATMMALQLRNRKQEVLGSLRIKMIQGRLQFNYRAECASATSGQIDATLTVGKLKAVYSSASDTLSLSNSSTPLLEQSPTHENFRLTVTPSGHVLRFEYFLEATHSEQFWGFGERYNAINQAGNIVDNYVYNQYRNQGIKTYMPMPLYFSSQQYAHLIESTYNDQFDLTHTPQDGPVKISLTLGASQSVQMSFFSGTLPQLVSKVSSVTGKPTMVPTWALGLWMSSNNWDRQSVVNEQLKLAERFQIPATVFVLEQWSDEATYYMFNDATYPNYRPEAEIKLNQIDFPKWGRWPDPVQMVKDIHQAGMRLILWQIPIMKEYPNGRNRMLDLDKAYAIDQHYVVANADGSPYYIPEGWFTNALVWDPTNLDARNWWFAKRQYLNEIGVDGYKTDGGECIFGDDLIFSNGQTGLAMRNQYPMSYIRAYHDFTSNNQGITFSRSGYIGAQTVPAHWAGDERSTFAAFRRSITAGLNAGLSGVIFWGWDFAGFNGEIPTAELYLRAAAMATFIPIMQYHAESKAQFNQDRTPWNIQARTKDERVIPIFRKFANLRMNLMPYLYDQARFAVDSQQPMMRALLIDYSNDQEAVETLDEYLFGRFLLIAPVIQEGATSRKLYLPEGQWCDFWSDDILEGRQTYPDVKVPIDKIAVYQRENSAILFNTHHGKVASDVGNQLDQYDQPLLRIFANKSFIQTIHDHLDHTIKVTVSAQGNTEATVTVESDLKEIKVNVLGITVSKILIKKMGESI